MADSTISLTLGVSPGKLVLTSLLAVLLVVVFIIQFGGEDNVVVKPREHFDRPKNAKNNTPDKNIDNQSVVITPSSPTHWPTFDLAEVLKFDPFARSSALIPPPTNPDIPDDFQLEENLEAVGPSVVKQQETEENQREETIKQLQVQGVNIVLIGSNSKHAVVGSQMVTIGDTLYGFVVSDIRPDGVILAESVTTLD